MTPIIRTFERTEEVHTVGISKISFEDKHGKVKVYQNDELITVLTAPIMRVVHAFRKHYDKNVILEMI